MYYRDAASYVSNNCMTTVMIMNEKMSDAMLKSYLRILSVVSISIVVFNFPMVSEAGCGLQLNREIQKIVDDDRAFYHIPAVQVSVFCPGDSAPRDFVSGTTTVHGEVLLRSPHIFQIGSETKSFIATILLQLEGENQISLDDPLQKWLPTIRPDWRQVSIRQLLNHTSGIYNYTDAIEENYYATGYLDTDKQWTAEALLHLVDEMPAYFEPGTGWHYSNTNYVLAGMVIEQVTHQSLHDVIDIRLVKPLHLKHTDYIIDRYSEERLQHMAHGYSDRGYFPDEPKDVTNYTNSWSNAAGAMNSTSHDIAIWFRHLVRGDLLAPAQMNEFNSFVDLYNGQALPSDAGESGYGFGIFRDDDLFDERAFWHLGGTLGYM